LDACSYKKNQSIMKTFQEHDIDNSINTLKDTLWYSVFEIMTSKLYIIFFVKKKVPIQLYKSLLEQILHFLNDSKDACSWGGIFDIIKCVISNTNLVNFVLTNSKESPYCLRLVGKGSFIKYASPRALVFVIYIVICMH
jgi:hypothetical protein